MLCELRGLLCEFRIRFCHGGTEATVNIGVRNLPRHGAASGPAQMLLRHKRNHRSQGASFAFFGFLRGQSGGCSSEKPVLRALRGFGARPPRRALTQPRRSIS
jgi:hypothetical protein